MKSPIKKMVRSPLRYPGGKSKSLHEILPKIYRPYAEFREPFVGGGSVFLAALQKINPNAVYKINDLNYDLYCFWKELQTNGTALIDKVTQIREEHTNGRELFELLTKQYSGKTDFDRAARFFVLNRITFSGTTDSGGYSEQAFKRRFTKSSITRLKPLPRILKNVIIEHGNYEKLLFEPGEEVFIFLDPPYYSATKSKLYGKNGDLHEMFNHEKFAQNMKKCPHKWLITYDNSKEIRDLFSFSGTYFYKWRLKYGMTNVKSNVTKNGKELMIANYLLPQIYEKTLTSF